ncbi:MAG: hypothetical protein ACLFU2_02165 [Opitutales bacterium]
MNKLAQISSLSALTLAASTPLFAAVPMGQDGTLFVDSSAAVEYQSNILRQGDDEQSDTIFVLTPGVEYRLGGVGDTVAEIKAGYELRFHADESDLNAEHARLTAMASHDSGIALYKGYLGYNEFGTNAQEFDGVVDQQVQFVPGVTEFFVGVAGGEVKYRLSDQTAFSAGADYFVRAYDGDDLAGNESISFPIKAFFTIAPELEALIGYRFRESTGYDLPDSQEIVFDFTDHYVFVGVQGQVFSPLWTVDLDVGYQDRRTDAALRWGPELDIGDRSTLAFSARVNYDADEMLNFYGELSRDFGQDAQGSNNFERTRLTLGGNYLISELWRADFRLTYANTDYDDTQRGSGGMVTTVDGREEDVVVAQFGLRYFPNEYLSLGGDFRRTNVDVENSSFPSYTNNVFVLSAAVRY